jgi:hypothetical protein
VANSLDGQAILVGEVKWTGARSSPDAVAADLMARVELAPFVHGRKVIPALWMRSGNTASSVEVVTPDTLLVGLKVTGVPYGRQGCSGLGFRLLGEIAENFFQI